jgi:hypothetical protein
METPGQIKRQGYISAIQTPPLTLDQAKQLVDASGLPPNMEEVKSSLAQAIVDRSTLNRKRRPFAYLLKLSQNVCSKEVLKGNIDRINERINELISEGESEDTIDVVRNSFAQMAAVVLEEGFDEASHEHFIFDATGNIVGITESSKTRYPNCLKLIETKWRSTGTHDGGKKKRRQTKKKNLKKRKTSRRIRN